MRAAIGLVAKAPVPGQVKTRLCPPLTPAEAAAVAAALLADTVDSAVSTGAEVWCVATGDRRRFAGLLPPGLPLLHQVGDGLGARLANALAALCATGAERVLLVGADCPTVDGAYLDQALAALDDTDVVVGPAADGGYTLLGARAPHPELFAGVPMGTSGVLAATLDRARGAGLRARVLEVRHDIDTVADLAAAWHSGQLRAAPRTRALISQLTAVSVS